MEGEGGEVVCVRDGCSEDFSLVGVVASYWIGCLCLCTCVFNKKVTLWWTTFKVTLQYPRLTTGTIRLTARLRGSERPIQSKPSIPPSSAC